MSDEHLRELERRWKKGDVQAGADWLRELGRVGRLPKPRENRACPTCGCQWTLEDLEYAIRNERLRRLPMQFLLARDTPFETYDVRIVRDTCILCGTWYTGNALRTALDLYKELEEARAKPEPPNEPVTIASPFSVDYGSTEDGASGGENARGSAEIVFLYDEGGNAHALPSATITSGGSVTGLSENDPPPRD